MQSFFNSLPMPSSNTIDNNYTAKPNGHLDLNPKTMAKPDNIHKLGMLKEYLGTVTDLASLQSDPGGYPSGGLVFDPGGSHSHGFVPSTSALSSGETAGHQHLLFHHYPTEITKYSKIFKAPNPISHVLFYLVHGEKVHDGNSLVTARSVMAKWINWEMDAVLSGAFEMKKNSSEVPYWQKGEQSYWHNGEQSKIYYSYQVLSYLCELCFMIRNA